MDDDVDDDDMDMVKGCPSQRTSRVIICWDVVYE
jgi:hypothetical protein